MPQTKVLHIKSVTSKVGSNIDIEAIYDPVVIEEISEELVIDIPNQSVSRVNIFNGFSEDVPDNDVEVLPTRTIIDRLGSNITIQSIYEAIQGCEVIIAFISDIVKVVDGVLFSEGEEGIRMTDNYPALIDFTINVDGELIVISPNADHYSLDDEGNLIFTV
jgi:hypothetical protein